MLSFSEFDLRSEFGAELLKKVQHRTSPQLRAVADCFARFLVIRSPFAPGFQCFGGEVASNGSVLAIPHPARFSVTGNGETAEAAFVSCLGEAAEFLSQVERPDDIAATGTVEQVSNAVCDGWVKEAVSCARGAIDWVDAHDIATGNKALLPADLCLRRGPSQQAVEPAGALSSGVAAGPTREAATLRAILELCERDAAALWWFGGRHPRAFPLEHVAHKTALTLMERLRQRTVLRRSLILDLTTDLGVPVIAAISIDSAGRGLACGLAARLDPAEAATAAVLEMCQMEMSAPLAELKRSQDGEAALNEADRRHLRRSAFAAEGCELLYPRVFSTLEAGGMPAEGAVQPLADRLKRHGVGLFLVDLTRPDIGVPAIRAVAPELQPFSTTVTTGRLARTRAQSGGDTTKTGTPLF